MFLGRLRAGTVDGNDYFESPHVRVVRCRGETACGREPCEDQRLDLQVLQQNLQRRDVKGRVQRFQDEVILAVRNKGTYKLSAWRFQTPANQNFFLASPIAEVVIDIQHRNSKRPGAGL